MPESRTATPTPDLTPKALRTRAAILETALTLFAERGYQATTMRDIAAAAGCSLGLAYRYYAAKEDLLVAVYERCSAQLATGIADLPAGTIAQRYGETLRRYFENLAPYRGSFGAISTVALNPNSQAGAMSDRMSYLRHRSWRLFREVIGGANDAPSARDADRLATMAYASYLLIMLFWVNDRSPEQASTQRLLEFVGSTVSRLRPLLNLPMVSKMLAQLDVILTPMFGSGNPSPP